MLLSTSHALAILAALSTATNAFTITHHNGIGCRGQFLSKTENLNPTSGCQQAWAGKAGSVRVDADKDDKDFGNVVVFFSGDDCKPSNIMWNGDAFSDEGCTEIKSYGSYEVWDLWKVEGMKAP